MRIGCLILVAVEFPLLLCGCREKKAAVVTPMTATATTEYKKYHLNGLVLAKSTQTNEITIKEGEIQGFMPAMTMVYKAKDPAVVEEVRPGDEISADLLVPSDSDNYLLDDVVITAQAARDFKISALPAHQLMVGERVPDVSLVNQDGKTIHLQDYRGKATLITFVYTRCPMPTACPMITSHFAAVNSQLARDPKAYAATHLISISIDPSYDKPPVLRLYGLAYLNGDSAAFSHWEFADTTSSDLKKLAEAFGLQYSEQDNQITHTMQTTLIGPDDRVVQTWGGSGWDPETVAAAVKAAASKPGR